MGMSGGGGSSGLQSEINVTPMVDIMLVLLIIFMVVTPLLQHGITVALPQNTLNPDEDPRIIKESSVVISIPANGEYYLGKVRVAQDDIKNKVGPMLEKIKSDAQLCHIPVVVLTTSASEEDILRSYKLHANAYVTKPVDLDQFMRAVRQIDEFFVQVVRLPTA